MTTLADTPSATAPVPRCLRCGYDLRGIAADGRCPECGLAVGRSLAPANELREAPPGWLAGLAWGAGLVAGAQVLLASLVLLGGWLRLRLHVHLAITATVALMVVTGTWMLTRRQRKFAPPGFILGWVARLLALCVVAASAFTYAGFLTGNMDHFATAGSVQRPVVALPLVLFLYLRRLALRLPAPLLARHCLNIGLGLTGSMLLSTALEAAGRNHWFRGGSVPEAWLVALALTFIFYAWSIAWLLGFAAAFRQAWRQSRATWTPPAALGRA